MRCLFVVLAALMMWGASLPVPVFAQEEPSEATPVSISRTDMRYISPYTPDGLNPALTAESTGSGVCGYPSSHAIDRPDARRRGREGEGLGDARRAGRERLHLRGLRQARQVRRGGLGHALGRGVLAPSTAG